MFQTISNSTQFGPLAKEDLHIYIIDASHLNQSIEILENEIERRKRKDKEVWYIDISSLQTISNAQLMLNGLPLDIDDDIFLFMFIDGDSAKVWETYRLAQEKDIVIKDFGRWTREMGLELTTLEKWQRRGDLSVRIKITNILI